MTRRMEIKAKRGLQGREYICALSAIEKICVVGDQSSGKSSLLESLSGVPFPEGSGIVTKCPIVVRTRCGASEEWFVEGSKICERNKVAIAIQAVQETRLNSGIDIMTVRSVEGPLKVSSEEIRVEYVSPHNVELVLVDLPGIIHHGEGVSEVEAMIRKYIQSEMTLIMVVREADRDPETLKALELAYEYDPERSRQLQVLTKFDNFSSTQNKARAFNELATGISQKIRPHGVCCRMGGTASTSEEDETEFFASDQQKVELDGCVGIKSLRTNRLPRMLAKLILNNLQALRLAVSERLNEIRIQLDKIGVRPQTEQELLDKMRDRLLAQGFPTLRTALSRSADMLGESMKKEILITEDDIHNKFSLHYYEPPIFQARWDELRIHSIAEVESILQNIVNFEETKDTHEDLNHVLKEKWGELKFRIMQSFETASQFDLEKEKSFGTMDTTFTTEYEMNVELDPIEVIEPLKTSIIKALLEFKGREFQDTKDKSTSIIRVVTGKQQEQRCAETIAEQICKRLKTVHGLNRHEYSNSSLERQQARRIFCALKAYEKIISKTYLDNYVKAQRDHIIRPIHNWIKDVLPRDEQLLKYAKESQAITLRRKQLQDEAEAMMRSLNELEKL